MNSAEWPSRRNQVLLPIIMPSPRITLELATAGTKITPARAPQTGTDHALASSQFPRYRITSTPLRRITFSSANAGPFGCLVPRSSCET